MMRCRSTNEKGRSCTGFIVFIFPGFSHCETNVKIYIYF